MVLAKEIKQSPCMKQIKELEENHPIRMFFGYVEKYYGAIREDVLNFFSSEELLTRLEKQIEETKGSLPKNEWYLRFVKLLQCDAPVAWYEMYLLPMREEGEETDKPSEEYVQYFHMQIPAMAEKGLPCEKVKKVFETSTAAHEFSQGVRALYGQEYNELQKKQEEMEKQLRELQLELEEIKKGLITSDGIEKEEPAPEPTDEVGVALRRFESLLQPFFEAQQNQMGEMLQQLKELKKVSLGETEGRIEEAREAEEVQDGKVSILAEETEMLMPEKKQLKIARMFQTMRFKRREAAARKLDKNHQLQELIIQMRNRRFDVEQTAMIRRLMDLGVSLEFLYASLAEEDAAEELQKLLTFLELKEKE